MASPVTPPAPGGSSSRYDIGVLFVHGIGQQKRKDTLRYFGKALFDWIERRMKSPTIVALVGTRKPELRTDPVPIDGVTPAQAHIDIPLDQTDGTTSWLLAEAWWGDDFEVPGMFELARWGFRAIPWTLGSHFGTRARRSWKKLVSQRDALPLLSGALAFLCSLALFVLAAEAALIFALAVLGLALLSPLAFTKRGAFLKWTVRSVAAIVGDTYALVANSMGAAEILGRVEADIAWIADRCHQVAVVAHSQGGAVAHRALRSRSLRSRVGKELKVLITFGSGLRKLEELQDAEGTRTAAGLFLGAAAFWGLSAAFLWSGLGWAWAAAAWGLVCFVGAGAKFLAGGDDPGLKERLTSVRQNITWMDYFASADPVPNGPLFDESDLVSVEVHNRGSALWDHTAYWSNPDGFVSLVASQIAGMAPAQAVESALVFDDASVEKVLAQRQWRVQWLRNTKRLAMLVGMAVIVMRWEAILKVLRWQLAPGKAVALQIGASAPPFVLALASASKGWIEPAFALILAWLPVCAVCALVERLWRLWDSDDIDALLEGKDYNPRWRRRTLFAFLSAAAVMLAVLAAFADELRTASLAWRATAVGGGMALAWTGVLGWCHWAWQRSRSKVDTQKQGKVPRVSPPAGR